MVRIVHLMPGRLRLRIEAVKGRPELAAKLHSHLSAVSGIDRLDVNIRTGSLLLLYKTAALRSPGFLDAVSRALGKIFPAHFAPGRVQVTVKRLKVKPDLARRIEEQLSQVRGIHSIKINPSTGGCLLAYDSHVVTSPQFVDAAAVALDSLFPRMDVRRLILRAGLRHLR